jgi:diacylglycerol O-acyltransferase / wax synthase
MPTRLTALDSSFLHLETPNAHMHVAWVGLLRPTAGHRPRLDQLRGAIAGRLRHAPLFRRRLAFPPLGVGEPYWVDDSDFDIAEHVTLLGPQSMSRARFAKLADDTLSEPLDRRRPLWRVYLAPRLNDGSCGVVCKMHHALVDGKSAVEVGMLLFDLAHDAQPEPPDDWTPEPPPRRARLALAALEDGALESFRAARGMARLASSPRSGTASVAGTLRRAALAVGDDLLRLAPSSSVNVPIGPRRTLVRYRTPIDRVLAVKRSADVTLNDVCLAAVAGAMRQLALAQRRRPAPLKVMIPVSVREEHERAALGNRISFAFIDLPVDRSSAAAALAEVHRQTSEFKRKGRAAGTDAVMRALGLLPSQLRGPVARAAASARVYNMTVSNIPGPRVPLFMLGAELEEAYPVVPLSEGHALSIGIFSYRDQLFFGIHVEPFALQEARDLPVALDAALLALASSQRPRRASGRPLPTALGANGARP